ncbi:MAG: hypothetical protein WBC83_02925 [Minisyncoccia bacterium]
MARYYYPNARSTTEGAKRIELPWLKKHNYLNGYGRGNMQWSQNGNPTGNINIKVYTTTEPRIEFSYKIKKHSETIWNEMDYQFQMVKIPCHFGGFKWYFVCGLYKNQVYCGRRARILYEVGNYFGCRKCADLSYESCNEGKRFRGGLFRILMKESEAEDFYLSLKRKFYKGKPTRKYRKYLRLENLSDKDVEEAERVLKSGQFY